MDIFKTPMLDFLQQIALLIEHIIQAFGYPGITAVMYIENLFPPIPTDPLLPFAGMLAGQGVFNPFLVWGAAVLGAATGSLTLYAIGAYLGEPAVRALVRRYGRYLTVHEADLDRVLALFRRYGGAAVFFGRSVPVLRSAVSLTAGASRMKLPVFLFFTSSSSALVTGFWTFAGYILGENWTLIWDFLKPYEPYLVVAAVIAGVIALGMFVWRMVRQAQTRVTPRELDPTV